MYENLVQLRKIHNVQNLELVDVQGNDKKVDTLFIFQNARQNVTLLHLLLHRYMYIVVVETARAS